MFIYSVRASSIKFFAVIILCLATLVGIFVAAGFSSESTSAFSESVKYSGVKTNEDRLEFIAQFIPEIAGEASEVVEFSVPENFDRIMRSYNEIQKAQGLDITKYKNKKVTRYTYELAGYEDYDGAVFVNLIIYRGNVIACDVSSADPNGFVKPLVKFQA